MRLHVLRCVLASTHYFLTRFLHSSLQVHGQFGIFANGDPIDYAATTGKARLRYQRARNFDYEGVKTKFIYEKLCRLSQSSSIETVCEIGFNAGLSAILMLEAAKSATVWSFDLGDFKWARRADQLVQQAYGRRRFPGVIFGDSTRTIPSIARRSPNFTCDAGFIDGSKEYKGRLAHFHTMRTISHPGIRVFLDEVTSMECMNGTFTSDDEHAARCMRFNPAYYPASLAHNHAVLQGLMRVIECDWPVHYKNTDGICLAELL